MTTKIQWLIWNPLWTPHKREQFAKFIENHPKGNFMSKYHKLGCRFWIKTVKKLLQELFPYQKLILLAWGAFLTAYKWFMGFMRDELSLLRYYITHFTGVWNNKNSQTPWANFCRLILQVIIPIIHKTCRIIPLRIWNFSTQITQIAKWWIFNAQFLSSKP